ncbi:MAG TPA: DUF4350 domain-containing protein [Gemmatimonadaceae bacterium]
MADLSSGGWLRPRIVLPALAAAIVLAVLLTPVVDEDRSPQFLTTRSSTLNGAKALRELFHRLGRNTSERITPFSAPVDSNAIYFVLGTAVEMSGTEMHALLGAVRRGARAVFVPERGTVMADSIGIRVSTRIPISLYPSPDSLMGTYDPIDTLRELLGVSGARAFHRYLEASPSSDSDSAAVWPSEWTSFMDVTIVAHRVRPEIAIMPMGRGEVVAIADPNFLRNDVLKKTAGAVLAVRIIERIDPSGNLPIVFDEFHQGFGGTDSPVDVLVDALTLTRPGRAALQIVLAGLLYLLVIGVRPIAPVSRARLERRSPLEHVGALSRAYETIGASRLAVQRLVRGVRRRHPLGAMKQLDDAEYLALLRVRLPALGGDIDLLTTTLAKKPTAEEMVSAGAAIDHIERNFIT